MSGDKIVINGGLVQTEMYCEGLMEVETALATVLNGANLRFSAAYTITSDGGSFTIAPTLCGPGCPPAPSNGAGSTLFGALALLLPVAALAWLLLRPKRGPATRGPRGSVKRGPARRRRR